MCGHDLARVFFLSDFGSPETADHSISADAVEPKYGTCDAVSAFSLLESVGTKGIRPIVLREDTPSVARRFLSRVTKGVPNVLTKDDLNQCHIRERAHYNGGDKFFAYLQEIVEHPRLTRYDYYDRKTKGVTSTWRVDAADMSGLDEAIAAVNVAPVFTVEELTALAVVTDESNDLRKHEHRLFYHGSLRDKGAVQWEAGRCRLTDLGRTALAAK